MKKHIQIFITFLSLAVLIIIHTAALAQPGGPPPPPGGGHGGGGNQPPGAPVGEGIFLLVGLAGLYAGKKVYDSRKPLSDENK